MTMIKESSISFCALDCSAQTSSLWPGVDIPSTSLECPLELLINFCAMAAMWAKTLLLSAGIASFLSSSSSRSANGLSDGSEYDFTILDPESPHGSPYGGFSRATASRLASLPLKLPPVGDKLNEFEPFYFQVRDALGRPFSCRAYHEDELDARTLTDGMFEPPVLRADPDRVEDNNKEIMDSSVPTVDEKDHESIVLNSKEDLDRKLAPLQGMCAQFHQGWWSYEWCYEGKVTQFHVEVKDLGRRSQMLTVGDVTSLGEFRERKVANTGSSSVNDHSGGRRGTTKKVDNADKVNAVEVFTDGDVCTETGKPRETTALLMCCSAAHTKKSRGTVVYNGEPFETDLVSLQSVTESKQKICTYTITVCTPLLCDDQAKQKPDRTAMSPSGSPTSISEELENMSVSEILDSVFGGKRSKCIQFGTGAWYVFLLVPSFLSISILSHVSKGGSMSFAQAN